MTIQGKRNNHNNIIITEAVQIQDGEKSLTFTQGFSAQIF